MASKSVLKIIVEAVTGAAEKQIDSLASELGGLEKVASTVGKAALAGVAGGALAVGAATIAGAAGVLKLTMEAAKVEQSRVTFQRLAEDIGSTADVMVNDLRYATRGMVSDADLFVASNKLVTMGLADSSEQASKLAEMGSQLAIAMGKDAVSGMEEFALLLANQSIPRLDTFGISAGQARLRISELMEANKEMTREAAFMQAVMELGAVAMQRVGEQGVGAAADLARLKATFTNIGHSIGRAFLPALGLVATAIQEQLIKYEPQIQAFADNAGKWLAEELPAALETGARAIGEAFTFLETNLPKAVDAVSGYIAQNKKDFDTFAADMEALAKRIEDSGVPEAVKAVWDDIQKTTAESNLQQIIWDAVKPFKEHLPVILKEGMDESAEVLYTGASDMMRRGAQGWSEQAPAMVAGVSAAFQPAKEAVLESAADMARGASTAAEGIAETVATEVAKVPEAVATGMGEAATAASTGMAEVAAAVGTSAEGMATSAQTAMDGVRTTFTTGWAGLATEASTQMTAIATAVSTGMTGVQTALSTGMTGLNSAARTGMVVVKNSVAVGMTNIKTAVATGMNGVITAFRTGFSRATGVVRGAVNDIKGAVNTGMSAVKGYISSAGTVVRGLGNAFSNTAGVISRAVDRIVAAARRAAEALANIKTPAAMTGASPSPFENTLVNVGNLMREMSRQTIPEFNAALGGAGPSQSNSYYYTLNVHSNASTEPIAADFMVLEALAGA